MPMNRGDIETIVGRMPEPTMLALLGATPNREELLQASAWQGHAAEILSGERPLPVGRIGLLVEILAEAEHPLKS